MDLLLANTYRHDLIASALLIFLLLPFSSLSSLLLLPLSFIYSLFSLSLLPAFFSLLSPSRMVSLLFITFSLNRFLSLALCTCLTNLPLSR